MAPVVSVAMAKRRFDSLTRISSEAVATARIAAAYRGLTLAEYISAIVKTAADRDIEEEHAKRKSSKPTGK